MMDGQSPEPLQIGVLGAARIAAVAIVDPAHTTGHRLVAIAARDRRRAEAFAATHGVERVLDTYVDVAADPEVEVVYNPLANGLHGPWNLADAAFLAWTPPEIVPVSTGGAPHCRARTSRPTRCIARP
jgi:predicted dehydrogenase